MKRSFIPKNKRRINTSSKVGKYIKKRKNTSLNNYDKKYRYNLANFEYYEVS